jgi:AraC-like DNA-binding protein
MRYSEIKPNLPLRPFVECFWILEGGSAESGSAESGGSAAAPPERILPDGCVELILNFGDRFVQHVDGYKRSQPRNFVVGQMTGPILISPSGSVELLGIRFQPGGTRPFFPEPAHELTDTVVDLGSISNAFERGLRNTCASHRSLAGRIAAADAFLCERLGKSEVDLQLIKLATSIIDRCGLVSVDQLASSAGVSSRQLERRFLREVGVGPKLLARIVRFQQVFRAVDQLNPAWATVAVECGYYDQAHLIRDFNQFAQQTPAVLFASQSSFTESFTRKTRTSDFSNTVS